MGLKTVTFLVYGMAHRDGTGEAGDLVASPCDREVARENQGKRLRAPTPSWWKR